jgi:oligoribonuclease NrnB/cAMP/cGMP phosphodiesterase (DHH superfamily)|tara:strand:- start:547 stop:819 length:273 start_codon:yes stop_codon:yes gene_type:complete
MEHEKILSEFKEYMDRLQIWKKNHGIFINDIKKLENSMNKMYDEYTNILIDYRRTKKERYLEEANSVLIEAINLAKKFSKVELLASLSKR